MATSSPGPLTPAERRARRNRATRLARRLGFVGSVEYRHVYSQSGGAQYGRGNTPEEDLLTVYAEAFERNADPEDFSLEALIAHECGIKSWPGTHGWRSELRAYRRGVKRFWHRFLVQ